MIVLGIDPGIAITGWGVVEKIDRRVKPLAYGVIETPAGMPQPSRLQTLYVDIGEIIVRYQPDIFCVEKLFFNTNAKTALIVGQARGVVLLAAAQKKLTILEFTPLQVKLNTTGYGKAEKLQVQKMVKELLCLEAIPKPDDAADALAVALCGAYHSKV